MNSNGQNKRLRLLLPSDGALHESSLDFLNACGLPVVRKSARSYMANMPAIDGATVLFQRTADITQKVEDGSAELGIVGLDRFLEYRQEDGPVMTVIDDLGFGRCELVLAVPDSWLDVTSVNDLADLAVEFRQQGKQFRITTKYPRLTQRFLFAREIYYFTLVHTSGSLEAAPAAGYADIIADLVASGTTLRENHLRPVEDGTILASQACLVGNKQLLLQAPQTLNLAKAILETVEGHLKAESYFRLTVNVQGKSPEAISSGILSRPELAGLQGPTISNVYNLDNSDWYSINLLVPRDSLLKAVEHLRSVGGKDMAVSHIDYLFKDECDSYQRLVESGQVS
jgi:ATP phosphoribosyltransferase